MNGTESVYGLAITYTDASSGTPGQISLSTTRSSVSWLWAHPSTDGGTDSVAAMQLDSLHRFYLYSPNSTTQAAPAVKIDPASAASFQIPVRFQPAGEIGMGSFTNGPQPGQ